MKFILWSSLLGLLSVGALWAQEPPTGFSFKWESGEISRDMSIQDSNWQWDGRTLRFTTSVVGRSAGMPSVYSRLRDKVVLSKGQLARLRSILEGLVNENSLSLLPDDYEGTLLEYTLQFGNPPRLVSFSAPQFKVDDLIKEKPQGSSKPPAGGTAGSLLFKMNELRDFLVEMSAQR